MSGGFSLLGWKEVCKEGKKEERYENTTSWSLKVGVFGPSVRTGLNDTSTGTGKEVGRTPIEVCIAKTKSTIKPADQTMLASAKSPSRARRLWSGMRERVFSTFRALGGGGGCRRDDIKTYNCTRNLSLFE